jgi:hypothetical protein
VSAYFVVRGCSLSALLMLRDAMSEAAEQRSSLLDANAQAEQLWGAAAESELEPANRAQNGRLDHVIGITITGSVPCSMVCSAEMSPNGTPPETGPDICVALRPSAGQPAHAERRQLFDSLADAVSADSADLGSAFQQADGLRPWQPQHPQQAQRQTQQRHHWRQSQIPQHQRPRQLSTFGSDGTAKQLFAMSGAGDQIDSDGELDREFGPQASSELSSFATPPQRVLRPTQQVCSAHLVQRHAYRMRRPHHVQMHTR